MLTSDSREQAEIKEKLSKLDMEQIMSGGRTGFPSFDEFCKNPEKWTGRPDELLASADKGSEHLKGYVQRHIYEIEGHRTTKLEDVERIANDYGIPLRSLDYRPTIIPQAGRKCDILVKFVSRVERDKRNSW